MDCKAHLLHDLSARVHVTTYTLSIDAMAIPKPPCAHEVFQVASRAMILLGSLTCRGRYLTFYALLVHTIYLLCTSGPK